MKIFLKYLLIGIITLLLFSYKLSSIPRGLTIDESAFAYNAILLSQNLHDENGRFFPAFVLSINGKDWRQPVTQYFITAYFKLIGPSIFNLRFTSVIVASVSALLLFYFGQKLFGKIGGIMSVLFFTTSPIIMIHSHLGLDNIMPIPFTLLWLIFLYQFGKTKNLKYLAISAIALGIGFYTHKSMRSFVPIWSILSILYIVSISQWNTVKNILKNSLKPISVFTLSLLPFYLVVPLFEYKYAGAVLGQSNIGTSKSIYTFLLSYLSSFDPSFLFITGDTLPYHSTLIHGMFLLASLPFFIFGISKSKDKFIKFVILCFFTGPFLFGFPESIHRASRLMALVPLFILISTNGFVYLNKLPKVIPLTLLILVLINFYSFAQYYFTIYPDKYKNIFYKTDILPAYKVLSESSKSEGLKPYVSKEISDYEKIDDGYSNKFLRAIYFPNGIEQISTEEFLPSNSVYLSRNNIKNDAIKLIYQNEDYYIYK